MSMETMLLLGWIVGSIAMGLYAQRLNRSAAAWGFLAIVLSPVLVLLLLMGLGLLEGDEPEAGRIPCPFCAEDIQAGGDPLPALPERPARGRSEDVAMRTLLLAAAIMAALSGCAMMSSWHVHRDTQEIVRCRSVGWGWLGTPMAMYEQNKCENALKERGFTEVSEDAVKMAVQTQCAAASPNEPTKQAICSDEQMKQLRGKEKWPIPGKPGGY